MVRNEAGTLLQAQQAEREAEQAREADERQSAATRLRAAIAAKTDRSSMALNSDALLRAALGRGS
jgi:hypothetical protein